VRHDQVGFDRIPREAAQDTVVSNRIHAPEPEIPQVGQAGAELVPQQPEQTEDDVAIARRVGHELGRLQAGLVLEQAVQDEQRVAQRTGDDHGVEAGVLVAGEVVVRHAAPAPEVLRVRTGVDRANRYDEAQPVGRRHLAAAPQLRQGDRGLLIDQTRVGACDRVGAHVVLLNPAQSIRS